MILSCRNIFSLFAVLFAFIPAVCIEISIDPSQKHQSIDGFGGSIMCWMEDNKDPDWAAFCVRELGVSIVRCDLHEQIIGRFDNAREFTENIEENMAAMNVSAREIDIGFGAAKNFYENAVDDVKIMATIWTPPHWMKTGAEDCKPDQWNRYTMGGTIPYTDSARTQLARYAAAAVKKVETSFGIEVYGLSPQNELDWWHACETYTESCKKYYSGDEDGPGFCTWIPEAKSIRRELDLSGLGRVRLMGPEHGTFGPDIWNAWQQMKYVRDIYNDPDMLGMLDIWCVHSYSVPNSPDTTGRLNWKWLWDGHESSNPELSWNGYKQFGKPHWQTECLAGENTWQGAMAMANRIQDALVAGNASAFLPWAIGSAEPGVYEITDTDAPYMLPKSWTFKHFARYIRPDAVRVSASPDNPDKLTVSAYVNGRDGSLIAVLINNSTASENATIEITGDAVPVSFDIFTSTESSFWDSTHTNTDGDILSVSVPAAGIVTLKGISKDLKARQAEIAEPGITPEDFWIGHNPSGDLMISFKRAGITGVAEVTDLTGRRLTAVPLSPAQPSVKLAGPKNSAARCVVVRITGAGGEYAMAKACVLK